MRWTKKLPASEKKKLVESVKMHRRLQLGYPTRIYNASRRLSDLNVQGQIITSIIRKIMLKKKNGPARVLDAGAGLLGVSGDLKKLFGNRIHITAITLRHPNTSKRSKQLALEKTIAQSNDLVISEHPAVKQELLKKHSKLIQIGRKYSKTVDRVQVGLLENMSPKGKYDVVLDVSGAISYTDYPEHTFELLRQMLSRGGRIVQTYSPSSMQRDFFEVVQAPKDKLSHGIWVLKSK